jgi:hypothetical protein
MKITESDIDTMDFVDENGLIKNIGSLYRLGKKGYFSMINYMDNSCRHLAASRFNQCNHYGCDDGILLTDLKEYIKDNMGPFTFYIFESDVKLLKWLAE